MSFVEVERLKTVRHNKILELVSGYDRSAYYGVEYEPHYRDIETIMDIDEELCRYLN
jgi:hypothetical protein